MASTAKGLPASFEPGKSKGGGWETDMSTTRNVKWVARLGSQTYGNPVVSGGRIFVGTNDASVRDPRLRRTRGGAVLCLDEATGKKIWQLLVPRFRTKDKKFNYDDMNLGICASPTVDGDRVYVLSSRGEVVCLDVKTGRRIWHYQLVHHGIWDYDPPAPPILIDITVEGNRSKPSYR